MGLSGTVVDMGMLFLLSDPKCLGVNLTLGKLAAAEIALANNFVWNELWTFKNPGRELAGRANILRRFLLFNAICGVGIVLAVLLLHLFHGALGLNVYISNALAIGIVTVWNFGMNARFNWGHEGKSFQNRLPLLK